MAVYEPYRALVRDWHDGDTAYVALDLGFGILWEPFDWDGHVRLSCRLVGIGKKGMNAPELRVSGAPNPAGELALAYARQICPPGTRVNAISYGWDAYAQRWDGALTLPDGRDFATAMVDAGQAVWKDYA